MKIFKKADHKNRPWTREDKRTKIFLKTFFVNIPKNIFEKGI